MKKIMLADVFLSGFLLAYEFMYFWGVQKFDDYDMVEVCMFLIFILSKVILNLYASFTFATKIGWQFSVKVAEKTKTFRIVHMYLVYHHRIVWVIDSAALCYFTVFYFRHLPKKSSILSIQYYSFPIICLLSFNMVFVGFTVVST